MKIRFEATPNPNTFRFSAVESPIAPWAEQPAEFKSPQEAQFAPMAKKLFGFPWAESVFIGSDFISLTKKDWVDWEVIAEPLASLIEEHLDSGQPFVLAQKIGSSPEGVQSSGAVHTHTSGLSPERLQQAEALSSTEQQIVGLLNQQIRPMVAMDGGDVEFVRFSDQIVYLRLKGSCSGCPSSTQTLKLGIEARLRDAIPEVREVVSV